MEQNFRTTVAAAVQGDAAAFNSLFARNLPPLRAFLRLKATGIVAQKESVDDLAQSVCREVLVDIQDYEYRGDEDFRKWLFLQATRKIIDRYRYHRRSRRYAAREARRPAADDREAQTLLDCYATLTTPSQHASAREKLEQIETALEALPDTQREAVALSRLMNLSYAEIADHLDLTESAVRGLVARGLARLSALLET